MFQHILIPTDGSEVATRAVEQGLGLAKALGARVAFLIVVEPFYTLGGDAAQFEFARETFRHADQAAAQTAADCEARAEAAGVTAATLVRKADGAAAEIAGLAEAEGCDLIVMGSHGRGGVSALVIGSQTQRVLALSRVPVLVCR